MKKNLRLFIAAAMCAIGVGQSYAQEPLVNITFTEEGPVNNGTYQGSASSFDEEALYTGKAMASALGGNLGDYAKSVKDPRTGKVFGSTSYDPGSFYYLKYNAGVADDALANAFKNQYTIAFVCRLDRVDARSYIMQYSESKYPGYNWFFGYNPTLLSSHGNNSSGWAFRINNSRNYNLTFQAGGLAENGSSKLIQLCGANSSEDNGPIETGVKLVPGKFYQIVGTVDWKDTKKMNLYVNGVKIGTKQIPDSVVSAIMPNIGVGYKNDSGSQVYSVSAGQWLTIGGDAACTRYNQYKGDAGYYTSGIDGAQKKTGHSASGLFESVKIWNVAMTDDEVKSLYTDDVKELTEADAGDLNKDMLLDVKFMTDGSAKDESSFGHEIVKVGEGAGGGIVYDSSQKRNVATFNNDSYTTPNYYYREIATDAPFTSRLADAFSIELYAKNASVARAMVPFGMLQYDKGGDVYGQDPGQIKSGYKVSSNRNENGIGYMISSNGKIGFNLNTCGVHTDEDDNFAKPIENGVANSVSNTNYSDLGYLLYNKYNNNWLLSNNNWVSRFSSEEGVANTEWQHVVMTYDRKNMAVALYVNGDFINEASLDSTEFIRMSSAAYQLFCIGADAYGSLGAATTDTELRSKGEWAWVGDMAICRLWGKALNYDYDIPALYAEAQNPGTTVAMNAAGYATLCVPYNFTVPTGFEAYVVVKDGTNNVLKKLADAGEVVAYGVPVVLKGAADATATIAAAPDDNAKTSAENILYGTFATKTVAAGVAGLLQADGSFALNTSETDLPTHTAYIPGGIFDVETGIKVIDVNNEVSAADNVYYDLSGRRINKPSKGLYLQKGKKVLVK